ncbi:MAG: hypothetical protein IH955_00125 [Chloroflexi bacterium]|nr:hypothetical protein [Chloroflexota bacterium]
MAPKGKALPKITMKGVPDISPVLHEERIIQAPLLTDPLYHSGVPVLAHQYRDRVSRSIGPQGEGYEGDGKQYDGHPRQTA